MFSISDAVRAHGSWIATPDTEHAQVATWCSVTHPRADALGDRVEQGLTDVAVETPVYGVRAEQIGEAVAVEPLHEWVPPHDRRAEEAAGVLYRWSPALAGGAHVVFKRR